MKIKKRTSSPKRLQPMNQLSPVMKKLQEHDRLFDKIVKKLNEHDKRFEQIEGRLDRLTEKILEHDVRLTRIEETMVTKKEFYELYNKIDSFLALYTKQDQEITIMGHQLHRHDTDIARIKLAINLT